jgi:hypothetical protein
MRLAIYLVVSALFFTTLAAEPAAPPMPEIGIVTDRLEMGYVFDTDASPARGAFRLGPGPEGTPGDCVISSDGRHGFVTDFHGHVRVLDLASIPPQFASGQNSIAISNPGFDLASTVDGRYLVVCGAGFVNTISVVDVASRSEISTFNLGTTCSAVGWSSIPPAI